jgi:hypothetical protein
VAIAARCGSGVEAVVAGSFVSFLTRNTDDQCCNTAPEAFRYLMSPSFAGLIEVLSAQSSRSCKTRLTEALSPKETLSRHLGLYPELHASNRDYRRIDLRSWFGNLSLQANAFLPLRECPTTNLQLLSLMIICFGWLGAFENTQDECPVCCGTPRLKERPTAPDVAKPASCALLPLVQMASNGNS